MYLVEDGVVKDWALSYSSSLQWEDMAVYHLGTVAPGSHTYSITADSAVFGCGPPWGAMEVLVFDDPTAVRFWSVLDSAPCAINTRPAGVLLTQTFTQTAPNAVVWVTGNMIRQAA